MSLTAQEGTATPDAPGFARISRDIILYALGSMAGKAIGIVLLPVLTRLLTPDQYGRLEVLAALGGMLISVLLLGMDVAATRLAFETSGPTRSRQRLFGAWVLLEALFIIPAAVVVVIAAPAISASLFGDSASEGSVQLVGLILLVGVPQYMALTILRIQRRPLANAAVSAGTLALNAVLAVGLLVLWRRDESMALLAYAAALLFGAALGFLLIGGRCFAFPQSRDARSLLVLGLPIVPAIAATTASEFLNRTILLGTSGAAEVGYFGVAVRFASVVGLLIGAVQLAWQPHAFALGTSAAAMRRISVDAGRILAIASSAVALVAFAAPELVLLLAGSSFAPAIPVVGVTLIGALATAVFLVASMPSAIAARTKDIGIGGTIGVAVAVGLNIVLARLGGAFGTGIAIATGQLIGAFVVWRLGTSHAELRLRPRTLAVVALAGVVSILCTVPPSVPIGVRALLLGVYLTAEWWEGTLREVVGFAARFRR